VNVVIRIGIASLEREDGRVGWSVELDDSLHGQWPVDEIRRFIVDIFHLNDHTLVVGICIIKQRRKKKIVVLLCR